MTTINTKRRTSFALALLLFLGLLLQFSGIKVAANGVITTFADLKTAIENAANNEVITIEGNFTFEDIIIIDSKSITLKGTNSNTTLFPKAGQRHFNIIGSASQLTLDNIVLDGKNDGGGITSSASTFKLSGGIIENSANSTKGGAIFIGDNTTFTMENSILRNNKVSMGGTLGTYIYGGAIYAGRSTLIHLNSGTITQNRTDSAVEVGHGGGLYADDSSSVTLGNIAITYNTATFNSGAVGIGQNGSLTINGSTIEYNTADGRHFNKPNFTSGGGAIVTSVNADVFLNSGSVSHNISYGQNGGLLVSGKFFMRGGKVNNNQTIHTQGYYFTLGSAVLAGNALVIDGGEVQYNTLTSNATNYLGGTLYCTDGDITINGGNISHNTVTSTGSQKALGGAFLTTNSSGKSLNLTINQNTVIENNKADYGGAIYLDSVASLEINGGTFKNNKANVSGGAIAYASPSKSASMTIGGNASFIGNKATNNGGAIYAYTSNAVGAKADIVLKDTILFDGNQAANGGAIFMGRTKEFVTLTASGSIAFKNNVANWGGAIYVYEDAYDSLKLNGVSFENNVGNNGLFYWDLNDPQTDYLKSLTTYHRSYITNTTTNIGFETPWNNHDIHNRQGVSSIIVTFDYNSGSFNNNAFHTQIVPINNTVPRPDNSPTKDGYTFKDWYLSKTLGANDSPFDFKNTTLPLGDSTVTSKYKVTLYAQYELNYTSQPPVEKPEEPEIKKPEPTKPNTADANNPYGFAVLALFSFGTIIYLKKKKTAN